MRLTIKVGLLRGWLVLFAFCLNTQTWAAPDYVTAWPKQVHVEKPDPVLGDKPSWEYWVYGEAFAKRFKGFPVEKADPELKGGLQAMMLRIFKKNFWQDLDPRYPEQYACELDVYFDSSVVLPLSESGISRHIFPAYPAGISEGFKQLDPVDGKDAKAIQASQLAPSNMKTQPLIFAAPLDGRFARFGVREYRPFLAPGLSVISLLSGFECRVTAPSKKGGAHWLSLQGERLWDKREGSPPKAAQGQYDRNMNLALEPGEALESKGYFRVPEAFNKVTLPKATLVKVLNWCIGQRHSKSDWRVNGQTISWQQMMYRCDEAEQRGRILPDPRYYPDKEGLQDTGY